MAEISQIKLPNNSTYDIRDGIGGNLYIVKGTQTAKTGTWTGAIGVPALYDGLTIAYYLPYAGDGNATLNLTLSDGTTTGAINCYYNNASRLTTHYGAGSTIILTYWSAGSISVAGTATTDNRWTRCEYDSTITYRLTDYYGYYKAYTVLYRYQICLTKNETSVLPINTVSNSTATTKTLTTESFNPFGPIYYYNTTTTISAGATIGANTLSYQYLADLRYSFNTGTTLTAAQAVYLVATLGTGCSATLASNPISQALPSTEDGLIYIYLGQAYDTYRIELSTQHPVYRYINGALRVLKADDVATVNGITPGAAMAKGVVTSIDTSANLPTSNAVKTFVEGKGYVTSSGITSVTIAATSPVSSSTSSAQTGSSASTTISLANAYGDTKNPYGTKTANYVLAGPASGSAAAPTFRALVAADIPISDWAKATSKPSYTFSEIGSKPTTLSGYGITNAYTKTEVDGLVAGVLHYKGTKATVSALPSSGNTTGDTWHITADGSEWAWDGTIWQELGTAIDLSGYALLSGASFTGPVEFGDSVTADTISTRGLVVSGDAVFTNNLAANTINGVTVGSNPKFTDTVPTTTQSKVTGISIAAHGTTSIGSASGWNAGTASSWTFEEKSIPNVTSVGSASTWTFEEKSIPNVTSAGSASTWTFEEKSIPNVTAAGSGSASLTFAMDTTDTKKLKITFSHTHTAPTIGTAIKVQSKSGGANGTAPTLGTAIKVQSKSGGSNGTAPSLGTAIKVQSKSGGSNSTVPSLTVTSTTVVTGTTHTVTDNGHTHAI